METTIVGMLAAFAVTALAVPTLRPLAVRWGLLDRPDSRKRHDRPVPAVGGLAIFLAAALLALVILPHSRQVEGFGLAASVIVIAGVADDLARLRWRYRLLAQIVAALIMWQVGGIRVESLGEVFGFQIASVGPFSIPLTVFATVGIVNAINMIDGVDGLAGTTSLMALVLLLGVASYAGNTLLSNDLAVLIGGLCGFLLFNLRTPWRSNASVFLGNAGSELLGLFIASATIRLTQNGHHPIGVQLAPFLVAPALIDCLTLILRRIRSGGSPFIGDRNHLHHMLLDAGWSPTGVVVTLAGATLVIGGSAIMAVKAHMPAPWFAIGFLLLWAAYFLSTRRHDQTVERLARLVGRDVAGRPVGPGRMSQRDVGSPTFGQRGAGPPGVGVDGEG